MQVLISGPGDLLAWWRRGVLYENHMASFRDGDGDGIGDLAGLTRSLDYLTDTLGVSGVWLSPCFQSPMLDQGFDISDYCAIEPTFGDMDDFDALIESAHARGLRVIADFVPNHTSDQHPWFLASRSSKADPMRDWYVWADARPDGSPPNNWTSEAGGSVWEWDEPTGQYYLHSFLREMPDLNWRTPAVREAMLAVLRFWLDRGVDGFRVDVAHLLMKDPLLRDNPVLDAPAANPYDVQHADFATQLHMHDRMHPDVHEVLRQIRAVVDEYPDTAVIGEIDAMDWPDWARYFGDSLDELTLPFAFRLIETPWQASSLAAEIDAMQAALPTGAWPILALGNHDRSRLATRIGRQQARVAAVLLLTLPGTPIVFYGDELGLQDQAVPRERQRDSFAFSAGGVSRDPIRTPMPWNAGRNGGFSTAPEENLWLPVSAELGTIDVETQLADPSSLLNLYRSLIRLRAQSEPLLSGTYRCLATPEELDSGCLVYERATQNGRCVVALNLTAAPHQYRMPYPGTVCLSTATQRTGDRVDGIVHLRPDEGVLVASTDV